MVCHYLSGVFWVSFNLKLIMYRYKITKKVLTELSLSLRCVTHIYYRYPYFGVDAL